VYRKLLKYPFVVLAVPLFLPADTNPKVTETAHYVPAIVLDVEEQAAQSNYVGDSPSDAPLQPEVHVYNVSVHLECGTYIGQLQSAFDYLPAILTSNRRVEVRLQKHSMQIRVPGEEEYRLSIVRRPHGSQKCKRR